MEKVNLCQSCAESVAEVGHAALLKKYDSFDLSMLQVFLRLSFRFALQEVLRDPVGVIFR